MHSSLSSFSDTATNEFYHYKHYSSHQSQTFKKNFRLHLIEFYLIHRLIEYFIKTTYCLVFVLSLVCPSLALLVSFRESEPERGIQTHQLKQIRTQNWSVRLDAFLLGKSDPTFLFYSISAWLILHWIFLFGNSHWLFFTLPHLTFIIILSYWCFSPPITYF